MSAVEDVTLRLHHLHLPKLDDADLVEYDHDAGTVASPHAPDPRAVPLGDASDV